MKRELIPGVWGRCGRAIPDPQASELDNVVPLRPLDRQGRDSLNPVPKYSMLSGNPAEEATDDEVRRLFWGSYLATLLLTAACALLLAFWPN